MIISIGREAGSGGREMALKLSKQLNLEYVTQQKLIITADEMGFFEEVYSFCNEKPANTLLQAIAKNEVVSKNQQIVAMVFEELARRGSFVILGRAANYFLRQRADFVSVFLHANFDFKLQRLQAQGYSKEEAIEYMNRKDSQRASFNRYYTGEEWGKAKFYNLSIDTSKCGIDRSLEFIISFVNCAIKS